MLDTTKRGWWKSAVLYQIYPKSFQDTNGDGLGDIPGVIAHLDYLEKLGIDGIWLSPVYDSPQVDNGYDISDYRDIRPAFGTLADMEALIREAKKRGIVIIMDLVLNHSSDRHFWFQEALKGRDNPYHDYYVWQDGTPDAPPNDLMATFGGRAWTYVPSLGQYYFHQFAVEQPDLNWENPSLRRELYDMIRFWVDKGVGGFRLDVIDNIGKQPMHGVTYNGPRLHEFVKELSREAFCEEGLITVGEAWGADIAQAKQYSAPDGSELSMVFQFEHIMLDRATGSEEQGGASGSLKALKKCMERWQQELYGQGWNSLFWDNHDLPRAVSRWGNDTRYRVESAKMLATVLHGMQGTPYIYQGEELGMTNAYHLTRDTYVDLSAINDYKEQLRRGRSEEEALAWLRTWSRDNARTPMQWSAEENAGFTTGKPWLPVNPNYLQINAEAALADPDSVFYHYQKLIALRKAYPVFRDGTFTLLEPDSEKLFVYTRDTQREHLLVVCNFTGETLPYQRPAAFDDAQLLLSNYGAPEKQLRPYEAQLFYLNEE